MSVVTPVLKETQTTLCVGVVLGNRGSLTVPCATTVCVDPRVSLKTLIDTGRGDLLSGEMGLATQTNLTTKQKMLIQVGNVFLSLIALSVVCT